MASPSAERTSLATLRPLEPSDSTPLPAEALARFKALPPGQVPIQIGPVIPRPVHPLPIPPPTPRYIGASGLTATFRYKLVSIARPRIDTTLLHLPGWSIAGVPPGSISTGSSVSNPGLLPLLPVAFIAVRDVAIRGTWSDADKAIVREALSGNKIASFGPLTLATKSGADSFDGSSLFDPWHPGHHLALPAITEAAARLKTRGSLAPAVKHPSPRHALLVRPKINPDLCPPSRQWLPAQHLTFARG